jgi:hypothetical protein
MRLFLSVLLTALIVPLAAQAHSPSQCPTAPSDPPALQFVGATLTETDGHRGVLSWSELCRTDWPGSRVCTTRDLIENGAPPLADEEMMWIQALWIDSEHEYSGQYTNQQNQSCKTIHKYTSLASPWFRTDACNVLHSVACCALVP